jgi:hypothetical protein
VVPDISGPVHAYIDSAPGCWRAYGEVLAREYSDARCWSVHRLTVDAYAVQHPGKPSRRAIQSECGHLVSLCLVLERGGDPSSAASMQLALRHRDSFRWLPPPESMGQLTVVDVAAARMPADHVRLVREWARCAWEAWADHHETVRGWLAAA